ncbi:MAG: hypothetical protein ACREQ3_06920, partial [Candidatus Binatia bacterium]
MRTTIMTLCLLTLFVLCTSTAGRAEPADASEVERLKSQVQNLQRTVEQLQNTIQTMQKGAAATVVQPQTETQKKQPQIITTPGPLESPLDQALKELGIEDRSPSSTEEGLWSRRIGGANLRLLDLSFDVLFYAGTSSERDEALQTLQGGAHDPRKRGFTLGQAELGLQGAVDPYFTGHAFLITSIDPIEGETITELEEAFLTTTSLPYGLQLEVGHFFTEFGQINPRHPHRWEWVDLPVINSRLFGGDGQRAPGFRSSWLTPLPWFSEVHFGMQNANGETMPSFLANDEVYEERAIGGRPFVERDVRNLKDLLYLTRWMNSWTFSDALTALVGFSGLYGPNATGDDGDTWIYGLDMKWRWRPANNFRGWPFVVWQTEVMRRDFTADRFFDDSNPDDILTLPGRTLHDWGLYTQLLCGLRYGWAAGLRYEFAGGSGASIDGRKNDPFRADRQRVSPL